MFKRIFFWGLTAGILSAVASIIYQQIHEFATYTDFSKVLGIPVIIAVNLIGGLLAAIAFWICVKLFKKNSELIFNLLLSMGSFASVIYPIFYFKLPLDIPMPEMFPLLTVPMHFLPAIAWFTIRPLFAKKPFTEAN